MRYCGVLHIAEMLANAARVAPDTVAVTLDDDSLTFAQIDEQSNRVANGLARPLGGARRPRAVVGRHHARRGSGVRGAREDRRGLRAAQRPGVGRRDRTGRRVRAAPLAPVRTFAPSTPRASSRPGSTCRSRPRFRRATRARPQARTSTSATRTSSSSRAAAPGGRKASCSRTAPTGSAPTSARPRRPAARGPCACSRSSTWRDGRSRWARGKGRRAGALRARARRGDAAGDDRAPSRVAALLHPGGLGAHPRTRRRTASTCRRSKKPTREPRRPRPSCSRAIKDALPHTRTRVFYGSTEAGPGVQLGDADLVRGSRAVSVSRSRASRCASTTAARS